MKKSYSRPASLLIGSCLLHAILMTGLWALVFKFDVQVISGKVWAWITLMWPLWLLALAPFSLTVRDWTFAAIAGIVILAPTFPTLYTFVVWTIDGFAP